MLLLEYKYNILKDSPKSKKLEWYRDVKFEFPYNGKVRGWKGEIIQSS